jgi:hypothetical protein
MSKINLGLLLNFWFGAPGFGESAGLRVLLTGGVWFLDVQDKSWTPSQLLVWCARIWGVSGFKGAFEWRGLAFRRPR